MDGLLDTIQKMIQMSLTLADMGTEFLDRYKVQQKKHAARILQFHLVKEDTMPKKKLPSNVREYRPGSYQARKTVNGVQYVEYGKTPEEAAENLQKAIYAPKTQMKRPSVDPATITFREFIDIWYTTYKLPKLAETSLYQVRNVVKHHFPDWIKALPLRDLSSVLVQKALNEVATDRMREYAYVEYSDCLGWAYDLEYIPKDIMRLVPAVRSEREPGKAMTLEDQAEFLAIVSQLPNRSLQRQLRFYLVSGARPGELKAMTADDFQKDLQQIHILGTKNKYSNRFIPYFAEIELLLAEFPLLPGEPIFPYTGHAIAEIMKKIYPKYTPKDLRHTFATRCKECGIPTDVYKQWLGHAKNSKVAETTYTHYETVNKIEAVKFSLSPPALHNL